MRFLLDTNSLIAWTARGNVDIQRRIVDYRGQVGTSMIVLHELYYGAFNNRQVDRNMREIDALGIPILPLDRDDVRVAGEIRANLHRAGTPIGPYYVLIAGQARARGLTVVTANVGEFSRVAGLALQDWTLPTA